MKIDFNKLDRAFNPKCVAIVGDKGENNFMWSRSNSNFKGKLYSVQIDPKEIEGIKAMGVKNYTSLMDVPEPVDLAIVAVPRAVTPRILDDCIRKDVAAAHFFTAGFSESDTEEGMKLERLLAEKAEEANFHLIGPNCMGVFNPGIGLGLGSAWSDSYSGQVGLISQSGMHAVTFNREAHLQGLDINKAVSFGNGTVLDSFDYLEYFGQDPGIKAIGMYIEGVRDGKRLLSVLREVSARKPVVMWKGGRTEEGKKASASHTRTMAVSRTIWDSAVRQGGAIKVSRIEELIDTLKALAYLPAVTGAGVGITGGSGGQSVVTADVFTEAGLKVPALARESYDELATFFDMIGGAYQNPVDTANTNNRQMRRIIEILLRDVNIDNVVLLMNARSVDSAEDYINSVIDIKRNTSKPLMVILSWSFSPDGVQIAGEIIQRCQSSEVPVFITPERGAFALRKALDYYSMKQGVN